MTQFSTRSSLTARKIVEGTFMAQTVGDVDVDTVIPFPQSGAVNVQVTFSAQNSGGTKGFSTSVYKLASVGGAGANGSGGSASDFGVDVSASIPTLTMTDATIRVSGEAGETINWIVDYKIVYNNDSNA